ncbi:Bacitracin export ATP-binding protein BceA [Streptococcus mitis]|uniref:Bacitracin export ATP-binding protein BceA n=1 Tax=Streptococcus mitis TaxID=28037 RepID=A0A3R9J6E9_STRMT|nr:Bacitracin export ATP-binding protein BceA [Streptococcus mitis]
MDTILRVESLKKYYGKGPNITKALDSISFQVVKGEFLGIMGSSGSGKTTLLNCLATIIKPTDGSIQMQEKDLGQLKGSQLADYRGKEIGYLFQNFELLDNLTAKENILLPLSLHEVDANESKVRLELLSQYLDISELLDKFPSQLSGGQRQRVAAARLNFRP